MNLFIKKSDEYGDEFPKFLIKFIPEVFAYRFELRKAQSFDRKVNESNLFEVKFDTREILFKGINNLTSKKSIDGYRIFIEENIPIIKYNKDLDALCRFITYGNTEIKGYNIIREVFDDVDKNLNRYIEYYLQSN